MPTVHILKPNDFDKNDLGFLNLSIDKHLSSILTDNILQKRELTEAFFCTITLNSKQTKTTYS